MAEGGGIGPRSNEGTRAYKARTGTNQFTLRLLRFEGVTTARFAFLSGRCGSGLRVVASRTVTCCDALGYVCIFMFTYCTLLHTLVGFPQRFTLDLFGKVVKMGYESQQTLPDQEMGKRNLIERAA